MTKDEILSIARRKGYFRVSHRWRDDSLRSKCRRLVKDGVLFVMPYWMVTKKIGTDPRAATFYAPVKAGDAA